VDWIVAANDTTVVDSFTSDASISVSNHSFILDEWGQGCCSKGTIAESAIWTIDTGCIVTTSIKCTFVYVGTGGEGTCSGEILTIGIGGESRLACTLTDIISKVETIGG